MVCPVLVLLSFSVEAEPINKAEVQGQLVHSSLMGNKLIPEDVDISLSIDTDNAVANKSIPKYSGGTREPSDLVVSIDKVGANTSDNKKPSEGLDTQLTLLFGFFIAVLLPMFFGNDNSKNITHKNNEPPIKPR